MTRVYEIALYPMACHPDGSSAQFNPSDRDAAKVDAPQWFDVSLNLYIDESLNDLVIEFEELTWGEAQNALALLLKQYPDAGLNDLTEQCRGHWEPPSQDDQAPKHLTAIYGTQAVEAFEGGEPLEPFTNAERAAYIQGAQDAEGWQMQAFCKD